MESPVWGMICFIPVCLCGLIVGGVLSLGEDYLCYRVELALWQWKRKKSNETPDGIPRPEDGSPKPSA